MKSNQVISVERPECKHDFTGDRVYRTQSGDEISWHTYKPWASYTTENRERLLYPYQEELEDPIVSVEVMCKKCKCIKYV